MVRLLAILSVVASMLTSSVLANPTFPGTCSVKTMGAPHGTTPSTDETYTVSIKQTAKAATGNTYSVTIDGTGTITGLLFYATDSATKARFGSFTKFSKLYSPLTTCKGENPKTNTLGHNSEAEKPLPVTFTWADVGHNAGNAWKGSFTGIIMTSDLTTWYVIPPTTVTGGSGVSSNTTAKISSASKILNQGNSTAALTTPDASSPTDTSNSSSTATDTSIPSPIATPSSAAHLSGGGSFVLCVLLSAFALSISL